MKTPPKAPRPAFYRTHPIPVPNEQRPVDPQDPLDVEVLGTLCGSQASRPAAHKHRVVAQVWGREECDLGPSESLRKGGNWLIWGARPSFQSPPPPEPPLTVPGGHAERRRLLREESVGAPK